MSIKRKVKKLSENQQAKRWVWEFSKRIVVAYSVFYFLVIIFSCCTMYIYQTLDSLPTLIDNINNTFKSCVFGYFVKAGIENIYKITTKVKDVEDTE